MATQSRGGVEETLAKVGSRFLDKDAFDNQKVSHCGDFLQPSQGWQRIAQTLATCYNYHCDTTVAIQAVQAGRCEIWSVNSPRPLYCFTTERLLVQRGDTE